MGRNPLGWGLNETSLSIFYYNKVTEWPIADGCPCGNGFAFSSNINWFIDVAVDKRLRKEVTRCQGKGSDI